MRKRIQLDGCLLVLGMLSGVATTALAADADELAAAFPAISPFIDSSSLLMETGDPLQTLPGETAAEVIDTNQVRLTNGQTPVNEVLGSTDAGSDGAPDTLRFRLRFDFSGVSDVVTALSFTSQFLTSEPVGGNNDSVRVRYGTNPDNLAERLLGDRETVFGETGPAVNTTFNIAGLSTFILEFVVTDAGDGDSDSAIVLSDFVLSGDTVGTPPGEPSPSAYPQDINLSNGSFSFTKTLLHIPGVGLPFEFIIHYNSDWDEEDTLGPRWTHNYNWYFGYRPWDLRDDIEPGEIRLRSNTGTALYFKRRNKSDPDGLFYPKFGTQAETLQYRPDGRWEYRNKQQVIYLFDSRQAGNRLVSITDPNGNQLRFEYDWDNRGRLFRVTDTRGQVAYYFYNDRNDLERVEYSTAGGEILSTVLLKYGLPTPSSPFPALLSVVDASDVTTTFSYDDLGSSGRSRNLIEKIAISDASGSRTLLENEYLGSSDNKVYRQHRFVDSSFNHRVTTLFGYETEVEVDGYTAGKLTTVLDPANQESLFAYDAEKSLLVRARNSRGAWWSYEYDDYDSRKAVVTPPKWDPRGGGQLIHEPRRSKNCDVNGNALSSANEYQESVERSFDIRHNMVLQTDAAGNNTFFGHDSRNNLTRLLGPANLPAVTMDYDERGLLVASTDRRGNTTRFVYDDESGDLLEEINALDQSKTYSYDGLGRKITETDPLGNQAQFSYDAGGRLLSTEDALGRTVTYGYDEAGSIVLMQADGANGETATTRYEYDDRGLRTAEIDPLGLRTEMFYEDRGKLERLVAPDGTSTTYFSYNDMGLLSRTVDRGFNELFALYDNHGRRTEFSFPFHSNKVTLEYDLLDRVTAQTDVKGNTVRQSYDERGLMSEIINARGDRIAMHYDEMARLNGIEVRLNGIEVPEYTVTHILDANGNALTSEKDATANVMREFDALDRLISRTDEWGNTIGYEYDAIGNLSALIYSDGSRVEYRYDEVQRLTEVEDWDGNVTRYEYDAADNLTRTTMPDGSVVRYTYDIANRLIEVSGMTPFNGEIYKSSRTLNAEGRVIDQSLVLPLAPQAGAASSVRQYGEANELTLIDGVPVEHDEDGNVISAPLAGGQAEMKYDALNRLIAVNDDAYRYDVDGLRTETVVGGRTTRYVNDPNAPMPRALEEHDANGRVIARYVWGLGLISRQAGDADQQQAGQARFYHFDERGSTIALTDAGGVVTDRYAYTPFGQFAGQEGDTDNPFTYIGAQGVIADDNGLYFMRARFYDPHLRRFLTRDDLSNVSLMSTQTTNLYSYAANDPVNQIDPQGEFGFIARAIAGGVINVAVAVTIDGLANVAAGKGFFEGMSLSDYGDEFVEGAVAGAFGGFGKTLTVFGGVLGGAAGGLTEALISDETGAWQEKVAVGALFGAVGGVVDAGTIKNSRKLSGLKDFATTPLSFGAPRRRLRSNAVTTRSEFTEGLTAVTFRELVGPGAIINEDRWHHAKEAFRDPEQKPPAAPVRGWNAQMSCGG